MATIFRPPYFFATWRRDPAGVATRAQSDVAAANRNLNLLKGNDKFFGAPGMGPAYDWPNPTLAKSRTVAAIYAQDAVTENRNVGLLKGKDKFFGAAGMGPNYDWPNPTLTKSRTVASVFSQDAVTQNRNPTLLQGKDRFFGAPGMGPNYDWPNPIQRVFAAARAIFSQGDVWQNALGTLLAVTIAAAPFSAGADPNPRGAVNRVALTLDPPNLLATTLAGQDKIYGAPGQVPSYDWTNPVLPRSRAGVEAQPNGQPLLLGPLRGQDVLYGAPGQVPAYDWPNPRGSSANRAAQAFDPPNITGALQPPFAQSDWPNPNLARAAARAVFEPSNLLGTVLAPATGVPFSLDDWPNPLRPNRAAYSDPPANTLALFNTVLVPLAWQGDVPWGAANRVALAGDPPNLIGTLLATPVVAGTPFTQADWPNPRGAGRLPLTFDPPDLLSTLLKPASSAVTLRPPLVFRNWSLSGDVARLPAAPPNLLVTTFVPPVPLPFNQSDWPNPRRASPPDRPDPPNLLGTTLGGPVAPPFFQTEWPNPVLATSRFVAITAPPDPRPLLLGELAGQDQFFGSPGQVPVFDWPNPRGHVLRAIVADPPNLLGTTLGPVVAAPFVQGDWPNPLGRRQVPPFDFPCRLALNSAPAAVPFSQDEWPNPARPRQLVQEQPVSTLALYNTVVVPLAWQGDVPSAAPNRVALACDWPNLLGTLLATPAPFRQRDWPTPRFIRPTPTSDAPNLLATTLGGPVSPPFRQPDWPNPMRHGARPPPVYAGSPLVGLLSGQDQFFGAPGMGPHYDWPNPRGAMRSVALLTLAESSPPDFVPPAPPASDTPESGFIANMGRMMIRRG